MPAAVVLAAGASVRMGAPKPLVRWRGVPLVGHVIAMAIAAGCDPIVVVEGAHALPDEVLGGRRGHPLMLPPAVVDDILAHDDDASLREALARAGSRRTLLVDDPAVLDNIDTPEDLARIAALDRG